MQPVHIHPFTLLLFLFLASSTLVFAQQSSVNQPPTKVMRPTAATNNAYKAVYTFNVLPGKSNTYGYDLLKNGVLVSHQPPEVFAMQQTPLTSAIQARRAAMFVIFKMKNNIQPATLSKNELAKVTIN